MRNAFARKLKVARLYVGMTQGEAAARSGLGTKSISSWETGRRLGSMKIDQLTRLLTVYGFTLARFFAWQLSPEEIGMDAEVLRIDQLDQGPFVRRTA